MVKADINNLKVYYERHSQRKAEMEEEKKDLSENLKRVQKQAKKKKEVITELEKLGN